MECNKDKARRAMDITARKLSENDYNGAKKFVNKAQNLYPKLDGLKEVLMMVDVYISATNKINGAADWYGVLGVDPSADDEAVKKQYKKLALSLHPDKNKFKGAEGAFKLISQAWCLLSDKVKRIAYDQKRKSKEAKTRMQKPPNPPHKPASHNGNQNARGGVDPSAGATSDKPASGMPKPPNPHKSASSYGHQNVRDGVDPSTKARSYKHIPAPAHAHAPTPADSSKQSKDSMLAWTMCNRCKTQCPYLRDYCHYKAIHCQKCGQIFIATQVVKPVNCSSSTQQQQQQQQQWITQNKATNKSTNGESSFGRVSSSSVSAAQKTPQASAKSQATNKNTNGAFSLGRVPSPSVSKTAKTPWTSVVRPVNFSSFTPTQQQQWSTQNKATNKSTNEASSSRRNSSPSTSAALKTPQASAKSQATNKNTNGASSSGRVSSPFVSATAKTPQVSVLRPVVNLSSSPQLQQQQQWSAQNTSCGTYSQSFASSSVSYTYSFQWSCSVSVTANSSSRNAANQAQESSKRVHEESQKKVAAAEKVLKKPRADGR